MNTQATYNSPLPFRAPDITQEQLEELRKKWGENRSQVIIRCIERIWQQEIGNQREKEKPLKGKETLR
jgi:hypothetical protein